MFSFLSINKKEEDDSEKVRRAYTEELTDVNARLCALRREFDLICDDVLIERIIYELLALSQHQRFLLRRIKELAAMEEAQEESATAVPTGA